MFKLWCEWGIRKEVFITSLSHYCTQFLFLFLYFITLYCFQYIQQKPALAEKMEKKVALLFLLICCCVMLNAQPDKVCGRYGDGGKCDQWVKREQAAEASIEDFPIKTMENKNRVARKFLKLKSRLYKKEDWEAVYFSISVAVNLSLRHTVNLVKITHRSRRNEVWLIKGCYEPRRN